MYLQIVRSLSKRKWLKPCLMLTELEVNGLWLQCGRFQFDVTNWYWYRSIRTDWERQKFLRYFFSLFWKNDAAIALSLGMEECTSHLAWSQSSFLWLWDVKTCMSSWCKLAMCAGAYIKGALASIRSQGSSQRSTNTPCSFEGLPSKC